MESGSDILCCRAHILGSVTNMFRGLFKDRLASLKASSFLPRWAIVCLLLFGVFLAVLVLLDLLLMIITANVDRGQWNQIRPVLSSPILRPWRVFLSLSPVWRLRCSELSSYLSKLYVTEPTLASLFHFPGPALSVLPNRTFVLPSTSACSRNTEGQLILLYTAKNKNKNVAFWLGPG